MKKIVLVLFYIFGFAIVSLLIFQIPHLISGRHVFFHYRDFIFSAIAGIGCGLIVSFFSMPKNKG
ncbi:MAG: hypothetical protein ABR968_01965 [Bacteroidales bacterium]